MGLLQQIFFSIAHSPDFSSSESESEELDDEGGYRGRSSSLLYISMKIIASICAAAAI
jgi:hypothetical protein